MRRNIVLASASRRRSQILNSCMIRHKVAVSNIAELEGSAHKASWLVVHNAMLKAKAVSARYANAVVIGADTLVALDKRLIGKPRTPKEAKTLLRQFSGRKMEVLTGLYVIDTVTGKNSSGFLRSTLCMKKITEKEVSKFFRLLGPYDKAGGFSIEGVGSMLFDDIKGSYFNILGLPMTKLRDLFAKISLDLTDFVLI